MIKKRIAIWLVFALVIGILQGNQIISNSKAQMDNSFNLSEPEIDSDGTVTWDCIYFGKYWQNDTNGDGTSDRNDNKEPIKWRVLSLDKNDAFLMADCILENEAYNEKEGVPVTWGNCSLRTYLNETFIKDAFSDEEQAAIQTTKVITEPNPEYGTNGGNDTEDKIYVPSIQEMQNKQYGFGTKYKWSRMAYVTDYLVEQSGGSQLYWLRSPGEKETCVTALSTDTIVQTMSARVMNVSVRPVLHLDLSATSQWSYAGQVTSWGEVSETKDKKEWNCVYFGNYWQSDTNGDGVADKKDQKEAIKWRILSKEGNKALLLADRCLDHQSYNKEYEQITWETCTLREWLNSDFIKNAFTAKEQSAIFQTELVNDAAGSGVDGGNNTEDKVFLLSLEDMTNTKYGFYPTFDAGAQTRRAKNTEYAKANNAYTAPSVEEGGEGEGPWWLRTLGAAITVPGEKGTNAYGAYVDYQGRVSQYGTGGFGSSTGMGVRPALYIDLEKASVWKDAGRVIWDGTLIGGAAEEPVQTSGVPATEKPMQTVLPQSTIPSQNTRSSLLTVKLLETPVPSGAGTVHDAGNAKISNALPKPVIQLLRNKAKNSIEAKWKKLTGVKGYQICYSTSKNWKGKKQKLVSKNKVVIKKLKKKKTYYFRVRAYRLEGAKKVYGAWSKIRKIKIRK